MKQTIRTPQEIIAHLYPQGVARVTTAEWKAILMAESDRLCFYHGTGYNIKGTRVGPGIYELKMVPIR